MSSPVNPIVSGLTHAFTLAGVIKHQRLQQQELELQKQRQADEQQQRTIGTQMGLADRGYKPVTPDQEAEIATGATTGPAGLMPSDIKTRMAKYQGQTYVRPGEAELNAEGDRQFSRKLNQTKALKDINTQEAVDVAKKKMDALGITMSDQRADQLGVPHGTKFMPENLDDFTRAISQMKGKGDPKKLHNTFLREDNTGGGTLVTVFDDGSYKSTALGTIGKTKTAGVTPGQQATQSRFEQRRLDDSAKQKKKDEDAGQKQIDALQKEEDALHTQNSQIGERTKAINSGSATDAKGKQLTYSTGNDALLKAQLERNKARIAEIQRRKNAITVKHGGQPGGGAAAPYAGVVPPNPY